MQGSATRPGGRWGLVSTSACAIHCSPSGGFLLYCGFEVPAKFLAHRGKHFFRKRVLLARAEAYKQRCGKNIHGYGFVDGGFDSPAALARILDEAGIFIKFRVFGQCNRGEIEQPGTNHAATPPDLSYVGEVQVVLLIFGKFRLVRVAEDIEAFGVSLHDSVFDAVVHHFDEMASPRGAAIDVTFFSSSRQLVASRSARDVAAAGSERLENGIELLNDFFRSADHHAVSALQTPNAAAGTDVHVMNAFVAEHFGAPNVVFEIRIAAVDQNVARLHFLGNSLRSRFGWTAGGHHDPCNS